MKWSTDPTSIIISCVLKNRIVHITLLTILTLLVSAEHSGAQTARSERMDLLQQKKIAFFNEKLQLTPAESAKFWPVYNDYQNRRDKIARDRNNLLLYYESNKVNMTENEASEMIGKYIALQQDETRLLEIYTAKFKEMMPAKKVMRIYIVELDFKKWLLENLRQNKAQTSPRN